MQSSAFIRQVSILPEVSSFFYTPFPRKGSFRSAFHLEYTRLHQEGERERDSRVQGTGSSLIERSGARCSPFLLERAQVDGEEAKNGSREAQIVIPPARETERKGAGQKDERGSGGRRREYRLANRWKRDSGHEGERQIKFDRKLHEIVGEPRWSAPVRQPMPTRLFLATDYHDRRSGETRELCVQLHERIPRLLTYRTLVMPQTYRPTLFLDGSPLGVSIQEEQSRMGCSEEAADNSEWMIECNGGERGRAHSILRGRSFNYISRQTLPIEKERREDTLTRWIPWYLIMLAHGTIFSTM